MIIFENRTKTDISRKKVIDLINNLFEYFQISPAIHLEIFFTSQSDIKKLNHQHRLINKPTDVLSFPQNLDLIPVVAEKTLGSIVICPHYIIKNDSNRNIAEYIIHGFLHLMSYDHTTSHDYQKWQTVEKKIIAYLAKNNLEPSLII